MVYYNDLISKYNLAIKGRFDVNIEGITDEIFVLKKELLPITNENVELHAKHHEFNKKFYEKIEKLEEERRKLLMAI